MLCKLPRKRLSKIVEKVLAGTEELAIMRATLSEAGNGFAAPKTLYLQCFLVAKKF